MSTQQGPSVAMRSAESTLLSLTHRTNIAEAVSTPPIIEGLGT
jgi:hypothetical protein